MSRHMSLQAGQSSEPSALQISGVTLTDQNGNISAPASGYDIQKTINVTGAATTTATTRLRPTDILRIKRREPNFRRSRASSQRLQVAGERGGTSASATSATTGTDGKDGSARCQLSTFTEFLSVGSQDAQVTALQQRLTSDGFYQRPDHRLLRHAHASSR